MISFDEFFKSKYDKSLDRLNKVKKDLSDEGLDLKDVDSQMDQIQDALSRRSSGTDEWYGDIVRIDKETLGGVNMWRLTGDDMVFHVPVDQTIGIVKIPINWERVNPTPKFIKYRKELFGQVYVNRITYTENRVVDVIPIRTNKNKSQYFLLRKNGLWFPIRGRVKGNELESAKDTLVEVTGAQPLVIKQLPSGWVKDAVKQSFLTSTTEYNTWILPFIAIVDPYHEMLGGYWHEIGEIPENLSNYKVLKQTFNFLPVLLSQFGKYK